jgi:hypothetical protein
MSFLKKSTSWTNAELGLIKICVLSAGCMIGLYFHSYLEKYFSTFLIIFLITTPGVLYLWWNKIKHS